jgi:hypothetical protein
MQSLTLVAVLAAPFIVLGGAIFWLIVTIGSQTRK